MPKRDALILIFAIVSGLIAFALITNFLKGASGSKHQFVMANQAIEKGQMIQNNNITLSKPVNTKNPNLLFLQIQDVVGSVALENISKGILISRSQVSVVHQETAPAVAEEEALPLPAGKRALTLSPKEIENAPTVLKPGDRVDILGVAANYEGLKELQTIVRAAQIISVEKKNGSEIKSFIMALSPSGVVVVTKAMAYGKLSIALRPDSGNESEEELTMVGYTEIIRGVEKEKTRMLAELKLIKWRKN